MRSIHTGDVSTHLDEDAGETDDEEVRVGDDSYIKEAGQSVKARGSRDTGAEPGGGAGLGRVVGKHGDAGEVRLQVRVRLVLRETRDAPAVEYILAVQRVEQFPQEFSLPGGDGVRFLAIVVRPRGYLMAGADCERFAPRRL